MTQWTFGFGVPPGPPPDDVGFLWALDLDGNELVALPGDREFVPVEAMRARLAAEIAYRTGPLLDQLDAGVRGLADDLWLYQIGIEP